MALLVMSGCARQEKRIEPQSSNAPVGENKSTRRVTFVQWSDLHLFDAGLTRSDEGVEEEAIDNRMALHWAVLETNRLVLSEHGKVDFLVITGDFGLNNVQLSNAPLAKKCDCPRRNPGFDGPTQPVALQEAVSEVAREFSALLVKKIYVVPGKSDLCNGDPQDLHRWVEFVLALQAELSKQQAQRTAWANVNIPVNSAQIEMHSNPTVVDLTFSAERLHGQGVRLGQKPNPPSENGIYLLGLNTAYFGPHANANVQSASDQAIREELMDLSRQILPERSYVIFTSVPDLSDPGTDAERIEHQGKANEGSSWKLPKIAEGAADDPPQGGDSPMDSLVIRDTREYWRTHILQRAQILGIFSGGLHSDQRETYPHNFAYDRKTDPDAALKFWVAPPLSSSGQWRLPTEKKARGLLLVTVGGDQAIEGSAKNDQAINPVPVWFSTVGQDAAAADDDKLTEARAYELDGKWDLAAEKYQDAIGSSDMRIRAAAARGYTRARAVARTWWWEIGYYFPPLRWARVHPRRMEFALPLLLLALLVFRILRQLKVFTLLGGTIKLLIIPPFRGRAVMNTPVAMTKGAPADEFGAQIQAATEEIRVRLAREQENWAARQISFLSPASSSLDDVVGSIPDVQKIKVGDWFKFLVKFVQLFRWSVDCGIAVLGAPENPAPANAPFLPGGELSAYAVLQWSLFVKNIWRRTVPNESRSSKADLARSLAELILGEAFARRGPS
jgi:hypothetical protein